MKENYEYIKELLEKFYNGESSREEEMKLTAFFASAVELPEDLEADRKVFAALSEAAAFGEAPADLDAKIMAAIDASTEQQSLASAEENHHQPLRRLGNLRYSSTLRRIFIGISAVAAVVALVFLLPFGNEKPVGGNSGQQQLASEKILDTLKNMEIVPVIPTVEELKAESLATAKAEEARQLASATTTPAKGISTKRKSVKKPAVAPEEEYTLSEEEMKAMEMAFAALDNASYMLSYAYGCMENSQERIADTQNMIDRILQ